MKVQLICLGAIPTTNAQKIPCHTFSFAGPEQHSGAVFSHLALLQHQEPLPHAQASDHAGFILRDKESKDLVRKKQLVLTIMHSFLDYGPFPANDKEGSFKQLTLTIPKLCLLRALNLRGNNYILFI
jgi:hypothetical protein